MINREKRIGLLMDEVNDKILYIKRIKEGRTNETYIVHGEKGKYIARIAGDNTSEYIDRDNELFNMKLGNKIGISPEIYAYNNGDCLMEYIDSPTIVNENELFLENKINALINSFKRLHESSVEFRNIYSFIENINIYKGILDEFEKNAYPNYFLEHEDYLYQEVEKIETEYTDRKPCHVDNYFGNILATPEQMTLIDWEYAGMCDEYNEIANLSLLNDMSERTEIFVLEKYFEGEYDLNKFYKFKMANAFMWSYWHLIKLNQRYEVNYNSRRWKQRLDEAIGLRRKYEGEIIR